MKRYIFVLICVLLLICLVAITDAVPQSIINNVIQNTEDENIAVIIEFKDEPVLKYEPKLETHEKVRLVVTRHLGETEKSIKDNKKKDYGNKLKSDHKKLNMKIKNEYTYTMNGFATTIKKEDWSKIENMPNVKKIWKDENLTILLQDSVPLINADDVWQQQNASGSDITGLGIKVAIIDTGIDYTHPDLGDCTEGEFLAGTCARIPYGYDFYNNDANPFDDYGHGTHVAGIVGANGSIKGVAPDVTFIIYKVCSIDGSCPSSDIISAIENATLYGVDVISISLGGSGYSDNVAETSINNAVNNGTVVVIAAGNSGPANDTIDEPGATLSAITVGAIDKSNIIASFSSRGYAYYSNGSIAGIKPDVVSYGVDINSTTIGGGYVESSGTSMSAPHVAGLVALSKQTHPDWSAIELKSAIMNPAIDLGYNANSQGSGRADAIESYENTILSYPTSLFFGEDYLGNNLNFTSSFLLNVTNKKNISQTVDLSISGFSEIILNETSIILDSGKSSLINVSLTVNNSDINDDYYFGNILLNTSDSVVSIPFSFVKIGSYVLDIPDSVYSLTDNISCSGYCFLIAANNVTIDGNGYTINYSTISDGYGISNLKGYNASTINNVIMIEGKQGTDTHAIYLKGGRNHSISNNMITITGTGNGIFLYSSTNSSINGNTINTVSGNSIDVYGEGQGSNNITNNIIYANGGYGIEIVWSLSNIIFNNTINSSGSIKEGIKLYFHSKYNQIINNNFYSDNFIAVRIRTASNFNNFSLNNITTIGTNSWGLFIHSQSNLNIFMYNNILTTGTYAHGIYIQATSDSNYFIGNNISVNGSEASAIILRQAANTTFINGSLVSNSAYDYTMDYFNEFTDIPNYFINTNFTTRKIRFFSDPFWLTPNPDSFTYNDDPIGSIFLSIDVDTNDVIITRTLYNWSANNISWSDTSDFNLTATYDMIGLLPLRVYNITNNSVYGITNNSIRADTNGELTFSIYLENSTKMEIKIEDSNVTINDTIAPTYSLNSTNSTYAGQDILHSEKWVDNVLLSGGIFSFCNGAWNGTNCGDYEIITENNYQENATAISCSGSWDVSYPCANVYDGDLDTYGRSDSDVSATVHFNYTKPPLALNSSKWRIKDYCSERNKTMSDYPDCWNQEQLQLAFWSYDAGIVSVAHWRCWDGIGTYSDITDWTWVDDTCGGANDDSKKGYEEGMYWELESGAYENVTTTYSRWINDSWSSLSGTSDWMNITKNVNSTIGATVAWCNYVNDTSSNWNNSCSTPYNYITTEAQIDSTAPTYSDNSTNSTIAGQDILHSLQWTDETGLETTGGYIFSFDNGTGTFTNDTWVAFTTNPDWSNVTKSVNSTVGTTIQWQVFANDTSDNWGVSDVYSYLTTEETVQNATNTTYIYISDDVVFCPTNGNIYNFETNPNDYIIVNENSLDIDGSTLEVIPDSGVVNITINNYGVDYAYYYKSFNITNTSELNNVNIILSNYPINNKVLLYKNGVLNTTLISNSTGYLDFIHNGFSTINFTLVNMPVVDCDYFNLTQGVGANGWYSNGTICFADLPINIENNKKEVSLNSLINNTIDIDIGFNVTKCNINSVYTDGGIGYFYKTWQSQLNCTGPAQLPQAFVLFRDFESYINRIKVIYN